MPGGEEEPRVPARSEPYSATPETDRQTGFRSVPPPPQYTYGATSNGLSSPTIRRSPERWRQRGSSSLISVPEEGDQSMDFGRDQIQSPHHYLGAGLNGEDDDERAEDVEEWLIDEELAQEGLYRGSYRRILTLYSLTPLSTLLAFAFFACFPIFAYPLDQNSPHSRYKYSQYFPYPFPELLTAGALWSLCQLLREQLFSLSSSFQERRGASFVSLGATVLQTFLSVLLQLLAIVLLLITPSREYNHPTWHDHAFRRVWAIALGWAGLEAIIGIKQGYENLALYRDVLVTVRRVSSPDVTNQQTQGAPSREHAISLTQTSSAGLEVRTAREDTDDDSINGQNERQPLLPPPLSTKPSYDLSNKALAMEVENDLDQLMALKSREELEEVYGMPMIYIPVFISCLHRINAVLQSLGNFLLLSGAYLRSSFSPTPPRHRHSTPNLNHPGPSHSTTFPISALRFRLSSNSDSFFAATLLGVTLCQLMLAILHTSSILPRIGVHTFVYVNLLISLGMFFAGLGCWEALV